MGQPIKQRLRVHQDWSGDIPLKNLWGVQFQPREETPSITEVGNRIRKVLEEYQPKAYQVVPDLIDKFSEGDEGYLLAQTIAMPTENVSINTTGVGSGTGGLIDGYYADNRGTYGSGNQISISFLETNIDVVDYFIKPWIVATAYKGLIEDNDADTDIKCNIVVTQYTRADNHYEDKLGSSQNAAIRNETNVIDYKLRKATTFYNCAPYNTQGGDQMSYNAISLSDITKTVGWIFSHYKLSTPGLYT